MCVATQEYYDRYNENGSPNNSDGANEAQYVELAKNRDWEYLPPGITREDLQEFGTSFLDYASPEDFQNPTPAVLLNTAPGSSNWSDEFEEEFQAADRECGGAPAVYEKVAAPDSQEHQQSMSLQQPGQDSLLYTDPAAGGAHQRFASDSDSGVWPAPVEQAFADRPKPVATMQLGPQINTQQGSAMPAGYPQVLPLLFPATQSLVAAVNDDGGEEDIDNDLESLMALCCS